MLPLRGPEYERLSPAGGNKAVPSCCTWWSGFACKVALCALFAIFSLAVVAVLVVRLVTHDPDIPSNAPRQEETCADIVGWPRCPVYKVFGMCSPFEEGPCARTCTGCTPFDEGEYIVDVIGVDSVAERMGYARTGSDIPTSLHGIWWMDQAGASLPIDGDPDYPFNFDAGCETLITFGDQARWDPERRCVSPVPFYAGTRGQWAGYNNRCGRKAHESLLNHRLVLSFCFNEGSDDEILIWNKIKLEAKWIPLFRTLGWQPAGRGYYYIPTGVIRLTMKRTPWGWDRVSTAMGSWTRNISSETLGRIEAVLPNDLWKLAQRGLDLANTTLHYPVLQVVDGDGRRTKHYAAWSKHVNAVHSDENGTLILPRRKADAEVAPGS